MITKWSLNIVFYVVGKCLASQEKKERWSRQRLSDDADVQIMLVYCIY